MGEAHARGLQSPRLQIPAAQRTLPRTFNPTGGSSGAGSGSPSYPLTSPKRDPIIQSVRASWISSWVRPIQFQNHWIRGHVALTTLG